MLSDAGLQFGTGCGGTSVASVLAPKTEIAPLGLTERLRQWTAVSVTLSERKVLFQPAEGFAADRSVTLPVRVGQEACRLQLSEDFVEWLGQPLNLDGTIMDEEAPQRALLLELASLDLLRLLEDRLGLEIRFGEEVPGQAFSSSIDLTVIADERMLALRIDLPPALARRWADELDRAQPQKPADHSGVAANIAIEAGSQELSINELESLKPGDIVMLASFRPVVLVDGQLVAPIRRQSDGFQIDGAFSPRVARAAAGALQGLRDGNASADHILRVSFEVGRATMTLGEIDALKPGQRLPIVHLDETGVDVVVGDVRIGRGELVGIGSGLGVRIVHLMPAAPVRNDQAP